MSFPSDRNPDMPNRDGAIDNVALAYVSLVVPNSVEYENPAVHRGLMVFKREILHSLVNGGFASVTAVAALPMPSFPTWRQLWIRRSRATIEEDIVVSYVPFINITPLKQISIGIGVCVALLLWGWRMRRVRERVIFSFNLSAPPIVFTALAAWLLRAKIVAYVCDITVPGDNVPNSLLHRLDAWLQRRLLGRLDGLIVIADAIAADLAPGKPFLRVDGGIPRECLEGTCDTLSPRTQFEDNFVIAATGSLYDFNGFLEILAAFATLDDPRYRLRIAGRGPLEDTIRASAAKDSRIEFMGFLSYEELIRLHASADVLISIRVTKAVHTRYAFPSKTMEYLSSGVPVVTTQTGHMAQEYGPFCFVLENASPERLAEMIQHVAALSQEEREEIGRKAREYMGTHKTWAAQGRKIVQYVKAVVANSLETATLPTQGLRGHL